MNVFLKILFLSLLLTGSTAVAMNLSIPTNSGTVIRYFHPRSITKKVVQKKTTPQPWQGYFSAKRFTNTPEDRKKLLNVRKNLQKTFADLFPRYTDKLKTLEVHNVSYKSRGLSGSDKIILNIGTIDTDDEMMSVFVHEMGHIVDISYFKGKNGSQTKFIDRGTPVLSDDLSVRFYQISWLDNETKKSTKRVNFVSGYAMENPFEDFAETFLMYRYHGDKFRNLNRKNLVLQKKYNFMKQYVFSNQEFQTEQQITAFINDAWDVTLLPLSN